MIGHASQIEISQAHISQSQAEITQAHMTMREE